MENSINDGDQKVQPIGQNPVSEPVQIPKKLKFNYLVIGLIILVFLLFLAYVLWGKSIFRNKKGVGIDLPNQSQSNEIVNFETITLGETSLNDSKTELFIGDAKNLYKIKLDGSKPILLNSFDYYVQYVTALKNGKILATVGYTKYKNSGNDDNVKGLGWVPVEKVEKDYLVNELSMTKDEIDENTQQKLFGINDFLTTPEKIYTKPGETPEIYSETFDGNPPKKIGTVTHNVIDGNYIYKYNRNFIPSFDGSYLLLENQGKGVEPMFVLSRDGSRMYNLDIETGWNSVIWSGNNILFAENEGKTLIITINTDGTLTKTPLNVDLSSFENFSQEYLSPDKKHLALTSRVDAVSMYDLDTNSIIPIEAGNKDTHSWFVFMSWNDQGNKFMYRSDINPGDSNADSEIKIYDAINKKSYAVAKYSRATTDENMTADKPRANDFHFDIR